MEVEGRVIAMGIRDIWGGRNYDGARKSGIWGGIVNFAWGFRRNMAIDEVFSPHIFILSFIKKIRIRSGAREGCGS